MKPTMGRIVFYHHPGSLDGRYQPCYSPAIIQHVETNGNVMLWVFGRYGVQFAHDCSEGDGPCQWSWPPRA